MSTTLPRQCLAMHGAQPPTHTPIPDNLDVCDGGRSVLRTRSRFHINNTSFCIKAHGAPGIIWRSWKCVRAGCRENTIEYVNYRWGEIW
jgi:hypothetical protein